MKVLVVGSGGREHALCYAVSKSPRVDTLYCAPGNGGIREYATCVDLSKNEHIVNFCKDEAIDFVVVGPEQPLVDGLSDQLEAVGIAVFGCSQKAAQLEGSKTFMKNVCKKYAIPTAAYESFTTAVPAKAYVERMGAPIVVKADGLAAGKGVIIAETVADATAAIDEIFGGKFGEAGARVVIEEFLDGEEVSFFALCDGDIAVPFASAQDHKRVGEGDTGPNTGGMGTYSPAPIMSDAMNRQVMETIIEPTMAAMKAEGCAYKGVLFAGLMIVNGQAKLLEFNVRFGDPETQVMMARLTSDIMPALMACRDGGLQHVAIEFTSYAAVCVVMASNGYPGSYQKGTEIHHLDKAAALPSTLVFHAGTKYDDGSYTAIGGRVLGVTARGDNIEQAQAHAYRAVDAIDWPEGFCRRDIGWRAIKQKVA